MPSIFPLLIAFQIALVRSEQNIQVGEKKKRQGLRDWTSNARSLQGEQWRDSQRFQCNTDRGNRGETGEKPLGEHIIWPLPSSGAVANRRGWVPTIPVTLEVSWRKATLINLSPRLRWMIASSNAQNNPPLLKPSTPQPAPPPALRTYKSTSLHIYAQSPYALSPSLFLLCCWLFSLFYAGALRFLLVLHMPLSLSGSLATNSELTHRHPVLMDF